MTNSNPDDIESPTAQINDAFQPITLKGSARVSGAITYYPGKGVFVTFSPITSPGDTGNWVKDIPKLLAEIKDADPFDVVNALDPNIVTALYGNPHATPHTWINLMYGCEKHQIVKLLTQAVNETVGTA